MTGMVRALWIGRFQPLHRGHLDMARRILDGHDELIVGVGSAQVSHTPENPFTAGERVEMIKRALEAEGFTRWFLFPIPDTGVHSTWVSHVLSQVPPVRVVYTNSTLVHRLFEEHGLPVKGLPLLDRDQLSGTEVRRRMRSGEDWRSLVPPTVSEYIVEIGGVERIRTIGDSRGGGT